MTMLFLVAIIWIALRLRPAAYPLLAFVLVACVSTMPGPLGAPESSPLVHQEGGATVIIEPERAVQETVSPQGGGRCVIDAAKICAAYGQLAPGAGDSMSVSAEPGPAAGDSRTVSAELGPAAGDSRTVSIQIPGGPVIAVQCRYAGPGGALVSAAAPPDTPLDGDSRAFLAAHGFCAAAPGG